MDSNSKKLISLMAEKFMTDVATDALAYARLKNPDTSIHIMHLIIYLFLYFMFASSDKIGLDDLSSALADQGVTSKRPPYHL